MKKLVVACSNSVELAKKIAKQINAEYLKLDADHFPDGESHIRFRKDIANKEIIFVQSMFPAPNDAMIEVIFATNTAYELGARNLTLVAPYLAYMRQDKRFYSGECQSNRIMARLLTCVDRIITVDPHLHRIDSLSKIFKIKAVKLSANFAIAEYIYRNFDNEIILGPDAESYQWAETIAKHIDVKALVLKKHRYTSRSVRIKLKTTEKLKGKNIVIVDDIISTGGTMIQAVRQAKKYRPKGIYCICVHGLYLENAYKKIKKAGARRIISTNTIENMTSKIDVSKLISKNLK